MGLPFGYFCARQNSFLQVRFEPINGVRYAFDCQRV